MHLLIPLAIDFDIDHHRWKGTRHRRGGDEDFMHQLERPGLPAKRLTEK
jgi:hypothetical protein